MSTTFPGPSSDLILWPFVQVRAVSRSQHIRCSEASSIFCRCLFFNDLTASFGPYCVMGRRSSGRRSRSMKPTVKPSAPPKLYKLSLLCLGTKVREAPWSAVDCCPFPSGQLAGPAAWTSPVPRHGRRGHAEVVLFASRQVGHTTRGLRSCSRCCSGLR